jgi:hypothetical protein
MSIISISSAPGSSRFLICHRALGQRARAPAAPNRSAGAACAACSPAAPGGPPAAANLGVGGHAVDSGAANLGRGSSLAPSWSGGAMPAGSVVDASKALPPPPASAAAAARCRPDAGLDRALAGLLALLAGLAAAAGTSRACSRALLLRPKLGLLPLLLDMLASRSSTRWPDSTHHSSSRWPSSSAACTVVPRLQPTAPSWRSCWTGLAAAAPALVRGIGGGVLTYDAAVPSGIMHKPSPAGPGSSGCCACCVSAPAASKLPAYLQPA